MFDMVDTAFSYGSALVVCYLQESSMVSMVKESSLHEIWNEDIAFLLSGADLSALFVQFRE